MAGAFWCIVEDDRQGRPKKVMAEILGEAARLGGGPVEAVWLTDKASEAGLTQLGELGATRVWLLENAAYAPYRSEVWSGAGARAPRARDEPAARVPRAAGRAARRRARGRLRGAGDGRRHARGHASGVRGQAAREGRVGQGTVGRDAPAERVPPGGRAGRPHGGGRAAVARGADGADDAGRAARGGLDGPARAGRGGDRRFGRARHEGAGELRDPRGHGAGDRRRRRRLARRGGRGLAAAPASDRPDGPHDLAEALHGLRRLGRDPAPGRHADVEGDRRGQQGPGGADLQDRRLRDRGRPVRGRAPAHDRAEEADGEIVRLDLTDEQQMIQAMAREFAETAIRPIAAEIDREARFPHETLKRMGELGLMGIAVPERWGGSGADTVGYALALEEIAKACASHAVIMSVNNSLYCDPALRDGDG